MRNEEKDRKTNKVKKRKKERKIYNKKLKCIF